MIYSYQQAVINNHIALQCHATRDGTVGGIYH